ncbi:YebG family protein [Thalassotalea aquiviva]|uniref:YebG family protein n=1 Tax=Thalassotalea aquiviva TaxID=3242415 RepID=UPI00352A606F
MAVESRFVVIRNGVEVETFMDKKSADEYDKMLDMADSLSELFEQSALELNETQLEDISIYLAKHREDVLVALQAKKPKETKKAVAKTKSQPKASNKDAEVSDVKPLKTAS